MNGRGVEVRTGTIMFTDLVGFTEFTDASGDIAAVGVLDQQQLLAVAALGAITGSRIVKELGDGLMFWFDRAVDGLTAARRILRSVGVARDTGDFPLNIRLGMHVGEIVERGTDFVGHTVNVAARVCDLAGPGELVVSGQFVQAVADASSPRDFRPIGPVRVRGVSEPVWLHRLVT
jgi:class 3 adenylate cyclase